MAKYNPPTKVVTIQRPYLAMVVAADPDFERRKHREIEYEFQGRVFLADPYIRGAYNQHSNTYPVGQPYGGLDAAVTAALAPTIGNTKAGLYQGTPDGKGWA